MAALRYRDEHNKVGYLQKPKGSDDYHQVLDFLKASHIRYALTNDPIIFDSLVKQFWSTATLRSQLQLADDGGIDDLPIAEIYSGMDNLGYVTEGKLTFYKNKFSPQWRFLVHTILHCLSKTYGGKPDATFSCLLPKIKKVKVQGSLSTPLNDTQTSDPITPVFEHGQSSDLNIASFSRAHETDDEPFTSTKVEDEPLGGFFHASPKAPKKLFKDVVGKLVKKVKAMEVKLKTKKRNVVVSDSNQEEGGEQAVDLDALIALANAAVTVDSNIPPGGASNNPAASSYIPTDVPTGGDFAPAHFTSPSRDSFKGKGIAKPSSPISERTKKQLADERLSEIEAARLEALERERSEKEKAEIGDQTSRELDLDSDGLSAFQYKVVLDEDSEDEAPILWSAFFLMDRKDILKVLGLVVKYYENHHVAGAGLVLWGDLQVLMDSQAGGKGSLVWNHQSHWQIRSWRLYTLSNVHVLETISGEVLYMFSDVSYPLSVKLMERMLKHKLEIDKDVVGNDMTTAEQLIRFIKNQLAAAQVSPA
ncbi:hypothetical protein Tco_0211572 [Tanacetum coccineum]